MYNVMAIVGINRYQFAFLRFPRILFPSTSFLSCIGGEAIESLHSRTFSSNGLRGGDEGRGHEENTKFRKSQADIIYIFFKDRRHNPQFPEQPAVVDVEAGVLMLNPVLLVKTETTVSLSQSPPRRPQTSPFNISLVSHLAASAKKSQISLLYIAGVS